MDPRLTLMAAFLGVVFTTIVVLSIRSSSMRPTFAWLWIGITAFLLSVPVFESFYKWFASAVIGIDDARTVVYVALLGFLLVYSLYMTLKVSMLSDQIQELISHTAILETRVSRLTEAAAPGPPESGSPEPDGARRAPS